MAGMLVETSRPNNEPGSHSIKEPSVEAVTIRYKAKPWEDTGAERDLGLE